jgi:hypothetical protein
LKLICEAEGKSIPTIVSHCIAAVEAAGLDYEGIYRKSGPQSQTRNLIQTFSSSPLFGAEIDLLHDEQWSDITVVTGCLKQWFRQLPEPVISAELYSPLVEASGTSMLTPCLSNTIRNGTGCDKSKSICQYHPNASRDTIRDIETAPGSSSFDSTAQ